MATYVFGNVHQDKNGKWKEGKSEDGKLKDLLNIVDEAIRASRGQSASAEPKRQTKVWIGQDAVRKNRGENVGPSFQWGDQGASAVRHTKSGASGISVGRGIATADRNPNGYGELGKIRDRWQFQDARRAVRELGQTTRKEVAAADAADSLGIGKSKEFNGFREKIGQGLGVSEAQKNALGDAMQKRFSALASYVEGLPQGDFSSYKARNDKRIAAILQGDRPVDTGADQKNTDNVASTRRISSTVDSAREYQNGWQPENSTTTWGSPRGIQRGPRSKDGRDHEALERGAYLISAEGQRDAANARARDALDRLQTQKTNRVVGQLEDLLKMSRSFGINLSSGGKA